MKLAYEVTILLYYMKKIILIEVFNGILEYLNNFPHFPHTNSKADI